MANDVRVRVTADTSGLRRGMDQAAGAVKGFSRDVGRAAGAANLLGGVIEQLGGASKGVAQGLGAVLGGFAGGGAFGAAAGAVQAVVGWLKQADVETKRAADSVRDRLAKEHEKNLDIIKSASRELEIQRLVSDGMTRSQAELTARMREQMGYVEALRQDYEASVTAQRNIGDEVAKYDKQIREGVGRGLSVIQPKLADAQERLAAARDRTRELSEVLQEAEHASELIGRNVANVAAEAQKGRDAIKNWGEAFGPGNDEGYEAFSKAQRDRVQAIIDAETEAANARGEIAAGVAEQANKQRRGQEKEEKDANKERLRGTERTAQAVGGAVSQTIGDVVTGARSANDALGGLMKGMAQMAIDWAVQRAVAEIAAHLSAKPAKVGDVTAAAGVAGANAAASVAGVPIIGPALALAAMAETSAAVLGSMLPLAVAKKGADLPAGGPFPALLHSREMVLPQEQADAIRKMGSGSSGGSTTINITAMDGASVRRVLMSNPRALRRGLREMQRGRR